MPFLRYTYSRDIAAHGSEPFHASEMTARVLLEKRRVEVVDPGELTKPQLAEAAERVGAKVRQRDSKGHFIKAIAEAEEP